MHGFSEGLRQSSNQTLVRSTWLQSRQVPMLYQETSVRLLKQDTLLYEETINVQVTCCDLKLYMRALFTKSMHVGIIINPTVGRG